MPVTIDRMRTTTQKIDIAREYLEEALRLYYQGTSFFSALHLAGAADELLGAHIELKHGGVAQSTSIKAAAVSLSRLLGDGTPSTPQEIGAVMNHARNKAKHMDSAKGDSLTVDAQGEARLMLDRAVSNYFALMAYYPLPETELVNRFHREQVGGF